MSYADSAIDYNWEIVRLDVGQRLMSVKYSADSTRPAIFLNHTVDYDKFTESDLTMIATSNNSEVRVVGEWDRILEARAANPSFDPNTLIGNIYSDRYKVRVSDASPNYNNLTHKLVSSDSEGYDEIRTSYTVTPMSDSEKAAVYADIEITRNNLWTGLALDNYMNTVASQIGVDSQGYDSYSVTDVDFLTKETIKYADSISTTVQSILGLNDSDWARQLSEWNAVISPPPVEVP